MSDEPIIVTDKPTASESLQDMLNRGRLTLAEARQINGDGFRHVVAGPIGEAVQDIEIGTLKIEGVWPKLRITANGELLDSVTAIEFRCSVDQPPTLTITRNVMPPSNPRLSS